MMMFANMYGSFLPMELTIERAFMSGLRLHPGVPSSMHGLSVATGEAEEFGFEDYLSSNMINRA